ncbi:MAG: acyl-CoA dehydrogenase family protein [Acidimicrobiales bacterium]|nr:acyl-CoA dehydrogenase family protein [Acidimicrobiales bacterium]
MSTPLPTADTVRADLDAWLDENWDESLTVEEWWNRLAPTGYAHPTLPENAGGKGWGRDLAAVVNTVMADREVMGPPSSGLGWMLAAPTIAAHATQEQIDQFVPEILTGQVGWCQLFSEPGAGSDLAGLSCKAEKDGDEWVITGQKVWTSGGQVADWGMLIARTDPEAPKHKGISYFAFEMDQPGVAVRPLTEMTGRAMFNEVFIDEARVLDVNMIGGLNNGWAVANSTLMFERASLGSAGKKPKTATPGKKGKALQRAVTDFAKKERTEGGVPALGPGLWQRYVDLATKSGKIEDPVFRQDLMKLYSLIEINRLGTLRAKDPNQRTGAEANIGKLHMSDMFRSFRDVGCSVLGADAMLSGKSEPTTGGSVAELTLFSPGPSIYGGTDQIQRNIIGERILGLPREPGPDKNTAFKDLPKN